MFSISGLNTIAEIAEGLLKGGGTDFVSNLIEKKLEGLGDEMISDLIGREFRHEYGLLGRAQEALLTGGVSELDEFRQQFLNRLKPAPLPYSNILRKFGTAFYKKIEHKGEKHQAGPAIRPPGKFWTWSQTRQAWLDRGWRHDWRSQPRNPHTGRWIRGRMNHPYQKKGARRIRRARRLAARKAVKQAFGRP